jgi:hypothetical protein
VKKDVTSFEVDCNLDIYKPSVDKPIISGELNIQIFDADKTKITILIN